MTADVRARDGLGDERADGSCPSCALPAGEALLPAPPPQPADVEHPEPTPAQVRRRVREVVTALMLAGLDAPLARMRVTRCATLRCRIHCTWRRWTGRAPTGHSWPLTLRDTLLRLGPAFVKIGQILSVRTDLVPPELARVLHTLQSDVPPVPFGELEPALRAELGEPIGGWLARVDERPVAAGSVAQVHVGWLADGRKVALKIKRPGIDPVVRLDLEVLRWLARQLERHWPASRAYRPVAAADELRRYTLRELDFRQEAQVARRLGERFAELPDARLRIPEIHHGSDGLIVMEFIEGFPADVGGYEGPRPMVMVPPPLPVPPARGMVRGGQARGPEGQSLVERGIDAERVRTRPEAR